MNRIIFNFKENEVLIAEVSSGINSSAVKNTIHLSLKADFSGIGIYNNSSNIANLKTTLQSLSFKGKNAEILLSVDGMITRTIETPRLSKRDLKSYIDKNMPEYFTVNPEEFYFDYKVINVIKTEKKLFHVLLAAIPKQKADDIIGLIRACGLNPASISIYPDCIYKLFTGYKDNVIGIFDINKSKSNIVILDKGQIFLYSNIQAEASGDDYDELLDSLGYFLNFYSARHFGDKVEKLYCIGELSADEKIIHSIRQQFGIGTSDSVSIRGVKLSKGVSEAPNELMDLYGYLLKENKIINKDINFSTALKGEKSRTLSVQNNTFSMLKAAIILCTILFICGSLMVVLIEDRIYDTSRINSQLKNYESTEKELAALDSAEKDADKKNNFVRYAENDEFDYYGILGAIKNGLPQNISVISLAVNKSTVTATFNINSTIDTARLNIALNQMKIFDHEEIVSTSLSDNVKTCTYNLTLKDFKKVSDMQGKK